MSHAPQNPPLRMGIPIPLTKLGMWLFLGTEIMFFTAFIGAYIVLRLGSPGWPTDPEDTHIHVWAGGLNTFVLLFSSYLVVCAHEAMGNHEFDKAKKFLFGTFALAVVFLGIKSYEYYGKFAHDILPGHIAENEEQAVDKALHEMKRGLDAQLMSIVPASQVYEGVEEIPESGSAADIKARTDYAKENLKEDPRFVAMEALSLEYDKLRNKASKTDFRALGGQQSREYLEHFEEDLHEAHHRFESTVEKKREKLAEQRESGASDEKIEAAEASLEAAETEAGVAADVFSYVHHPHPMLYGNLFASTYFLMTGFHAVHVIVGMILFLFPMCIVLTSEWTTYVENAGLYWHFVDLVWIFLFPLLYIA